ncbi:MAG: aromatic amino acid transport family protein [Candidatus Paceibacterota bacterium]|jgi:amino acid permease
MSKEIYAISTLVATIVGVGIFSLPYVAARVGLPAMLLYFFALSALLLLFYLILAEISLATPDYKRLPGFAEYHLGPAAKNIALGAMVLSSFGSILAYLIIGGDFLAGLLDPFFRSAGLDASNSVPFFTFVYWALGAAMIFLGIKTVAKTSFWALILLFAVLGMLLFYGLPFWRPENLMVKTGGLQDIFLPYGAIVFSLWGADMIPEIEEMLGKKKFLLKKVIFKTLLIVLAIYLFFIFLSLGVAGAEINSSAIASLGAIVGPQASIFGYIFGLLASFTSFIATGLTLKKIFHYDMKISKVASFGLTCFVPLIMFFAGFNNFLAVVSLIGGVMLGVNGILILAMYRKIKPGNNFLLLPLALVLLAGVAGEVIQFIN